MKKVLVGGVFNIIHPGHMHFLKKAKEFGDFLIVVIARDETVKDKKEILPLPLNERKKIVDLQSNSQRLLVITSFVIIIFMDFSN